MKNLLILIPFFFITLSSSSAEEFSTSPNKNLNREVKYKVSIDATPLVRMLEGTEVTGNAQIRINLIGNDGSVTSGELCTGIIPTISFEDEYIGRITGVQITINGSKWTKPITIQKITVNVSGDEEEDNQSRKFTCGCTLTTGNTSVFVDAGGPVDFVPDENAILADELSELIEMGGDFADNDIKNGEFTISKIPGRNKSVPSSTQQVESGDMICTTQNVRADASFDINFISNPTSGAIYPGALIYGENISNGSYSTITAKRKPITISTDLSIQTGDPMAVIENPSQSSIRTAINKMLVHQTKGTFQIQGQFEVVDVYSQNQLSIALGGHFAYGPGSLDISFDSNGETQKTTKVAKFSQIYYHIDVDQFNNPLEDVFANRKDAEEVLNSGMTPLYVGTITYGRIAYFTFTTSKSNEEINAILTAAYNGGAVETNAEAETKIKDLLEESKMNVLIIGGDGSKDFAAVDGYEGFLDMLRSGGTLDATSMGLPISYTLRFLSDNSVARTNLTTDYVKRECRKMENPYSDIMFKLDDLMCVKSSEESGIQLTYVVKADLYKNDVYQATLINESKGSWKNTDWIEIKTGGSKPVDKYKTFNVKNTEINQYTIKIGIGFTEFDYGWNAFDPDDKFQESTTVRLKDILGSLDSPKEPQYLDIHSVDKDHLQIYYSATLEE